VIITVLVIVIIVVPSDIYKVVDKSEFVIKSPEDVIVDETADNDERSANILDI
jgi:hypothetical protein